MRHYETVVIADPDIPADAQNNLFEKVRTLISDNAGELIDFDDWGSKRLAYEIRKKQRGYYVRLDYCGNGNTVGSLENAFRIDERVLKFMTILLSKEADPEKLKAALEASRQQKENQEKAGDEDPGKPAEPEQAESIDDTDSEGPEDDKPGDKDDTPEA